MHVAPADRARAFRKLITLLKPGGVLAITLRHGAAEEARGMHPVSAAEIETLARDHGALVVRTSDAGDMLGRKDVRWTHLAVRLPDDGTGALPLLRHIILNDDKSSTYKLALLRTLCRIAAGLPMAPPVLPGTPTMTTWRSRSAWSRSSGSGFSSRCWRRVCRKPRAIAAIWLRQGGLPAAQHCLSP